MKIVSFVWAPRHVNNIDPCARRLSKKFAFALVKVVILLILLFASDACIAGAGEKSGTEIPLYSGAAPGSCAADPPTRRRLKNSRESRG